MSELTGVQKKYAPNSICFGCGPANDKGLRIDSHRIEGGLKTEFKTDLEHQAFPGIINGGIIGTLLDCHGNWTAAIAIMDNRGEEKPSCTVTANYSVKLIRPTPLDETLIITSKVVELLDDRATISMELHAGDKLCAKGKGLFVSVKEGHPAYHRWH
ncbi:MAG: PaaI family thioesterase [Methanobacteriota archaeon]|nr:MAG: PaaI family thioesterase [Euryarchaeota archaeon]|tara:strand:- start:3339 stop:3809 length:471 start_codon:yes stop_codon:yes gene_type:complete